MGSRAYLGLCATAVMAASFAAGGALGSPDLKAEVEVAAENSSAALVATELAHAVVTIRNLGLDPAGAFEVDVTATDATGAVVLGPHSLNVTGLAAGANITIEDLRTFTVPLAGDVRVFVTADPGERVNDTSRGNNAVNRSFYFGPPGAVRFNEDLSGRASGTRTLPAYSYLAFKIDLRDGDALIFQANATGGALFDCYLFDAASFTAYTRAREGPGAPGAILFVLEYSRTSTDHIAFSADPLPPGTYYLVIENDERLRSGASPEGAVTVAYALAVVNNSLPSWAVLFVLGAAGAAIWAIVRWRPHFDVHSPLLEVPPPDPDEPDGVVEEDGEGEPPHPPPPDLDDPADDSAEG